MQTPLVRRPHSKPLHAGSSVAKEKGGKKPSRYHEMLQTLPVQKESSSTNSQKHLGDGPVIFWAGPEDFCV